jgi:hypothetical protein
MTPSDIAAELGVDAKAVRHFLRQEFPRSEVDKWTGWALTPDQIDAVRARFGRPSQGPLSVDPVFEVVGYVQDGQFVDAEGVTGLVLKHLAHLGRWSPWCPFEEAATSAPKMPGVYLAREGTGGPLVYIGMAGERRGNGLRGRLNIYSSGKGLASGLGEAVFDRALADAAWLAERLHDLEANGPARAKLWGRAAFERANLYLCWLTTEERASALALERECLRIFRHDALWNRYR